MKLIAALLGFGRPKKANLTTIDDYKRELLIKQGRDQFEKLMKKGLNVPIALL